MIRNFLFHRVNPRRDKLWDPMDVKLFDKCVNYISNKYEVTLIEELALSDEKLKSRNKYATLMFDDGYKDNIEYAAPILKKYKVKASFYVVTECIDKNIPTWTHILDHAFGTTHISHPQLDFDFLPEELKVDSLASKEDRMSFASKLKPFLKTVSHEERQLALDRVSESFHDVALPKIMLNWNDLSQLINEGHYVGSHTVTHSMLGTMTDESAIKKELVDSGNAIKNKLGYFPLTISYPVGSYNESTKRISKDAGYKIGLAVKQNVYIPEQDGLFEISRIELYNEPWWKTRLRITNSLENLKSFIGYK